MRREENGLKKMVISIYKYNDDNSIVRVELSS